MIYFKFLPNISFKIHAEDPLLRKGKNKYFIGLGDIRFRTLRAYANVLNIRRFRGKKRLLTRGSNS